MKNYRNISGLLSVVEFFQELLSKLIDNELSIAPQPLPGETVYISCQIPENVQIPQNYWLHTWPLDFDCYLLVCVPQDSFVDLRHPEVSVSAYC